MAGGLGVYKQARPTTRTVLWGCGPGQRKHRSGGYREGRSKRLRGRIRESYRVSCTNLEPNVKRALGAEVRAGGVRGLMGRVLEGKRVLVTGAWAPLVRRILSWDLSNSAARYYRSKGFLAVLKPSKGRTGRLEKACLSMSSVRFSRWLAVSGA